MRVAAIAGPLSYGLVTWLTMGIHRVAILSTGLFFVAGLFTSEVWFGWATEEELQPNIDGLSFDETLLAGLIAGIVAVVLTRRVTRRRRDLTPDAKQRG